MNKFLAHLRQALSHVEWCEQIKTLNSSVSRDSWWASHCSHHAIHHGELKMKSFWINLSEWAVISHFEACLRYWRLQRPNKNDSSWVSQAHNSQATRTTSGWWLTISSGRLSRLVKNSWNLKLLPPKEHTPSPTNWAPRIADDNIIFPNHETWQGLDWDLDLRCMWKMNRRWRRIQNLFHCNNTVFSHMQCDSRWAACDHVAFMKMLRIVLELWNTCAFDINLFMNHSSAPTMSMVFLLFTLYKSLMLFFFFVVAEARA